MSDTETSQFTELRARDFGQGPKSLQSFDYHGINLVSCDTAVVNGSDSTLLSSARIVGGQPMWDTFAERIQWLVEHRRPKIKNQTDLARKAKLSLGVIAAAKSREKSGSRIEWETAQKLAEAGGVDAHWLWTGEGAPDSTVTVEPKTDLQNLKWAAPLVAKLGGVTVEQAKLVLLELLESEMPGAPKEELLLAGVALCKERAAKGEFTEAVADEFTRQATRLIPGSKSEHGKQNSRGRKP